MGDERAETEMAASLAEAGRFQRDLYLYWRAVGRMRGSALTSRGYVARQALRRLRADLAAADQQPEPAGDAAESDDPRLLFLRRLLERLRLLHLGDEGAALVAADASEMARYVALPLGERLRLAARLWVAGGWWPERFDPAVPPPGIMAPAPPRVAVARRRLLDALAGLDPGAELPQSAAGAAPASPRLTSRGSAGRRRNAASRTPAAAAPADLLLMPLVWLGLVRCVQGPGQQPFTASPLVSALRPHQAGAPRLDEPRGPVTALPNRALVAYPPLSAPELALLDACADETALQRTATYSITAASVGRAHRAGLDAGQVIERLEGLTGAPLPANVATTLRDWERRAARVQLTPGAVVVTVRDPATLDALLADREAGQAVERRLAPVVALLQPDGAAAVRRWLLRRGELPASIRAPDAGDDS